MESPTTPAKQNSKWGGYNLDVAWDHKIYTARKLGKLSPSATTETPMPPDRMTGFNPWPRDLHHGLSVRCVLWKGVDNLLNHTLSPAGTSGGTDKGSY